MGYIRKPVNRRTCVVDNVWEQKINSSTLSHETQLSIIESPYNLYVVFVNECLYVTVQKGAAGTVWL